MSEAGSGYITDIPYTRGFYRELAPAWLDFTAVISGVMPPDPGREFSWCELGCGQGVTAVILAATHPEGRFVGIDLMPEHIAHARRLAAAAGAANAVFHAADFAAPPADLPRFDYIVAHGVYSWIGAAGQAALRHLVERSLKPGGLLYLSYNAMPGWAAEQPFQRLLTTLGRGQSGDSGARFLAATHLVRQLAAADAPSLKTSAIVGELDELMSRQPLAYLAHEYMGSHWQPLFVTEVRDAMRRIGLEPAGSAAPAQNFDSFVLRGVEREALAAFDDPDLRELARDFLLHQRFRRDVFSRGGVNLDDDERRERLTAMRFALTQPAEDIAYQADTAAGKLSFDNGTARGIVGALADGPQRGAALSEGRDAQDVVANLMALCSAGAVRPVALRDVATARINAEVYRRIGGPEPLDALALCCGTAVRLDPAVLRQLRDGLDAGANALSSAAGWARFLAAHTVSDQ